jgi:hypothetical protein
MKVEMSETCGTHGKNVKVYFLIEILEEETTWKPYVGLGGSY